MRKHSRYRARFADPSYWDSLDETKRGFIPVEFQGEIRWARPIFGFSSFIVPTKEFCTQNRDKIALIVEFLDEDEGLLAWSGMTYWEGQVPEEVTESYPLQKLHYLDENWKIFSSGAKGEQEFTLQNLVDDTKFRISRKSDEEFIELFDGVTESHIRMNEKGNFIRDEVNKVSIQSTEDGVLIENEETESSITLSQTGITVSDGQNKTSIVSDSISLGSKDSSKEPLLLGDTLVGLLQDLISTFNKHTHPTGVGPSGPPIPSDITEAEKISKELPTSKSQQNTTD